MNDLHTFETQADLFDNVASRTAHALNKAISDRSTAFLALSGGSTPRPIYERLAQNSEVDWSQVTVTLVDERMTELGDPASNEVLVRESLLTKHAGAAKFQPLEENARGLPTLDAVILGMGSDGHFASLFPTAAELEDAFEVDAPDVLRMTPDPLPANAPFPRLTLTLRVIREARSLTLAITGEEKRQVFEQAQSDGSVRELPIRSLLALRHPDLFIAWAP